MTQQIGKFIRFWLVILANVILAASSFYCNYNRDELVGANVVCKIYFLKVISIQPFH